MQKISFLILFVSGLFSCKNIAQISGCTDSLATNYNPQAQQNDGSCAYAAASVAPVVSYSLDSVLVETSGLIWFDNQLFTHNDNSDVNLYGLDTSNGNILQMLPLAAAGNQDWEEISQDADYIYIGDFGNNVNGNRTNLHILKIAKSELNNPVIRIDTIFFSYSDQTNLAATGANNTDFDCEAFIANSDSIYLFTKQWISGNTRIYSLSKQAGRHIAQLKDSLIIQGLVTGASYIPDKKLIALSGYTGIIQPFIFLVYDLNNFNFSQANKRKISLNLPFYQVEGLAAFDNGIIFISNEELNRGSIHTLQKLHKIDLSPFLNPYFNRLLLANENLENKKSRIFPNPATDKISLEIADLQPNKTAYLYNLNGQNLRAIRVDKNLTDIDISSLPTGFYLLRLDNQVLSFYKK